MATVCEQPHMSIGEAVRCGCVRSEFRELWAADIVSHPDLFRKHGSHAVSAYTSTKTTNRVPNPIVAGRADGPRYQTRISSVRQMRHMSSGMGHPSDNHLELAMETCKAFTDHSYYCKGYCGCVTNFHHFVSENLVATLETPYGRQESNVKTIPHLRFPGARACHGVVFPNNRVIIPACGTLENAVAQIPPHDPDVHVPIGYNPSRWQAVVETHDKLKRALTITRVDENTPWERVVARAVSNITAKHRARGVCFTVHELSNLLEEMAQHVTRERPFLDAETLTAICCEYADVVPARRSVPADLTNVTMGAMRKRRRIMCHSRIE